jgi:polysaccharide export outer membrane protein
MLRSNWTLRLAVLLMACHLGAVGQQAVPPSANREVAERSASAGASGINDVDGKSHAPAGLQQRNPRYILQAGDSFDISFDLSPEFNQSLTIQPDGFVTLRGVGDVHVAGETVPQLSETIRGAYSKVLNDPIISILLKDFEKPYFTVDGQVGRPGKYDLRGDTTVIQALAVAGGVLSSAKHSQVLLFRHVSNEWVEAHMLDVKKMMKQGNLNEDLHLRPGDMVFVPKNVYSRIQPFLPTSNIGTFLRY